MEFYLFWSLKIDNCGHDFQSNEEGMAVVEVWHNTMGRVFSSRMMALEHHRAKCFVLVGRRSLLEVEVR